MATLPQDIFKLSVLASRILEAIRMLSVLPKCMDNLFSSNHPHIDGGDGAGESMGVRERGRGGQCRGEHGSEWSEREEGMVQGRAWERVE